MFTRDRTHKPAKTNAAEKKKNHLYIPIQAKHISHYLLDQQNFNPPKPSGYLSTARFNIKQNR